MDQRICKAKEDKANCVVVFVGANSGQCTVFDDYLQNFAWSSLSFSILWGGRLSGFTTGFIGLCFHVQVDCSNHTHLLHLLLEKRDKAGTGL